MSLCVMTVSGVSKSDRIVAMTAEHVIEIGLSKFNLTVHSLNNGCHSRVRRGYLDAKCSPNAHMHFVSS